MLIISYDDIWSVTSKKGPEPVGEKISNLANGFERYMNGYYYESPVRNNWRSSGNHNCYFRALAKFRAATEARHKAPSDVEFITKRSVTGAK